jgi:hypothetical protein
MTRTYSAEPGPEGGSAGPDTRALVTTGPSARSISVAAAPGVRAGRACKRSIVTAICEWPSVSITTLAGTPWTRSSEAQVWRRSWTEGDGRRPARTADRTSRPTHRRERTAHPRHTAGRHAADHVPRRRDDNPARSRHPGTWLAYVLNFRLTSTDGPSIASTVTHLLPVVSIGLGVTFADESLSWNVVVGTSIVPIAVAGSRRAPLPAPDLSIGHDELVD